MAKIGILSTNRAMIGLAQELSFETGHDLLVKLGIPNEKINDKVKLMQKQYQVDAIIASASLYEKINLPGEIPIIRTDLSNFELVRALHKAFSLTNKVVFVGFRRSTKTYDLEMIKQTFGFDFDTIIMEGVDEVEPVLRKIKQKGYEAVATQANCILGNIPRQLHGIEIQLGKAELFEAVNLAVQSIEAAKKDKDKIRWMQAVVDTIHEGVIVCDGGENVETFNEAAEEITGFSGKDLVGHNMKHLGKNRIFRSLYGDGSSTASELVSLDSGKIVVDRIPIFPDDKHRGLVIKIQRITKIQALEQEIRKELAKKGFVAKATFSDIVGESKLIQDLKVIAKKYAATSSNIIIHGESGTGKELFAQSIHNCSPWHKGPFVAVNCAALSETLLESELFGYEEGAFTGAKKGGKPGLFELAHGGSIFLDEIGDMPLSLQSRLLRVLQEKEVIRLGGSRVIPVNNRIICATNRNLSTEVEKGAFRKDLYYRINILQLYTPPVREHPEDIPALALAICQKKCRENKRDLALNESFLEILKEYNWPGNTREIEAFVERLLSLNESPLIQQCDIVNCFNNIRGVTRQTVFNAPTLVDPYLNSGKILINLASMEEMEAEIIGQVNDYVSGNKDKLEQILKISKTTLWRKLKRNTRTGATIDENVAIPNH